MSLKINDHCCCFAYTWYQLILHFCSLELISAHITGDSLQVVASPHHSTRPSLIQSNYLCSTTRLVSRCSFFLLFRYLEIWSWLYIHREREKRWGKEKGRVKVGGKERGDENLSIWFSALSCRIIRFVFHWTFSNLTIQNFVHVKCLLHFRNKFAMFSAHFSPAQLESFTSSAFIFRLVLFRIWILSSFLNIFVSVYNLKWQTVISSKCNIAFIVITIQISRRNGMTVAMIIMMMLMIFMNMMVMMIMILITIMKELVWKRNGD